MPVVLIGLRHYSSPGARKLKDVTAAGASCELTHALVGHYEFPPSTELPTGAKVTIWRQGDQLVGQAHGENTLKLPFDIYAESQTNFFLKINDAQLTFVKNDKGEVTSVIHHVAGLQDWEGKKLMSHAN